MYSYITFDLERMFAKDPIPVELSWLSVSIRLALRFCHRRSVGRAGLHCPIRRTNTVMIHQNVRWELGWDVCVPVNMVHTPFVIIV